MKSLLAAFLMMTLAGSIMAGNIDRSKYDDSLTSVGKSGWTIENLGPQVTLSTVMSTAVDPGETGRPAMAFFSIMGEPGKLVIVDFVKGSVLKELYLDEGQGSYGMRMASDGNLYMSSHSSGILYRYRPGADQVENLGKPFEHITFIWDVVEGPKGKIYGACYPGSTVFEYDINTGKFRDLGPAKEGEDYARSIAWDESRSRLYVGIGSHADIIEIDPATGSKRSVLPERYKKHTFVYSIGAVSGQVIARMDPGNKAIVIDAESGKEIASMPTMTGSVVSPPGSDGEVYFSGQGKLYRYNPAVRKGEDTGYEIKGEIRGFAWTPNKHTLLMATTARNVQRYNPKSKEGERRYVEITPQALHIQNIIPGPDGRIYSSGYVSGQVGILDPATGEHKQYGNAKQAEGMTFYNDQLYLGTYPGANLTIFDTTKPGEEDNPRTLFNLHDEGQDRPFGMLAVPELGKIFMGTVPGYGLLGGALAVMDEGSTQPKVFRNLIKDQGIVTFAYRDGILYGGTTVFGGLGIEPTQTDGKLFLWDAKKSELISEHVPVKGKRGICGLQFGPDGNLWGWAEGALFVFDPVKLKTVFSKDFIFSKEPPRHFWRGGTMTAPVDGLFYGCAYGKVFSIDCKTREFSIIAQRNFEVLKQDIKGDLYVINKNDLVRLRKK